MLFVGVLLNHFASVEPIYFDSIYSHKDEASGAISIHNINEKIVQNEENLPNEASLHRQVLFHARRRLTGKSELGKAPRSTKKILTLTSIPNVVLQKFADDMLALKTLKINAHQDFVIFTPFLYDSGYGNALRKSLSFDVFRLDFDLQIPPRIQRVVILGLEKGWIDDGASDRLAINRLKEIPGLSLIFAVVESRDNQTCHPSVVAQDC